MPSWKKVITSGSSAALQSLTVTGGITGSLFGTSSWANNAVTASFVTTAQTASFVTTAQTASFVTASNVFGPFGSNSVTSASFAVSSSRAVTSSFAVTASFVTTAQTASFVLNAVSSSRAATASLSNLLTVTPTSTPGFYPVIFTSNSFDGNIYRNQASTFYFDPSTSTLVTNFITSSLFGTASYATQALSASFTVSASFASTASSVNTLNQNVLITGSLTVGSSSLGSSENTITLGARDGVNEGGQLGFNAPGGTYTSASMIDNYQNRLRILRGTNAGSDAEFFSLNLHSGQAVLNRYTGSGAFPGSVTGILAVDSSGNILTTTAGGTGTVTQVNTSGTVNGITLTGGPITTTGTITLGGTLSNVQSSQLATSSLMVGNSSISLGATASSLTGLTSVTATSFTGSLQGTSSWATNVVNNGVTSVATAGSVNGITLTGGTITSTGTITLGGTLSNVQSSQLATSSIMIGNSSVSLGATASSLTGLTSVTATSFTGSLFGTSSWANNATTASFVTTAQTASYVLQAVSSSFASTASFVTTAQTASFVTTAQTASFVTASNVFGPFGSNSVISASFAVSSSRAVSSSFATNASTASYVLQAVSSSFATTASYVLQAVSSSFATNASTASYVLQAVSSSFASTASFVTTAQTASFVTASNVYGPFGSNSIISASYAVTASRAVSSSYALTASYANNPTISGSISLVDYIDFNPSASYTLAEARLGWDIGEGGLQLGMTGGNVQYSLGEQLMQYCYNTEGTTLTKGQVVLISGSQGNRIAVKLADNSADSLSAGTLGFVAETIAAGQTGWVITEGNLKKINTIGYTAGTLLYLGSTPGTYTQTPPTAPSHSVRLGYVERVHATVGSIYVKIDNGYELGELHDVVDNTTTSSYGDLLIKSGSVWINSRQLTGSYGLTGSLGQGIGVTATGIGSHAEGYESVAVGNQSHAEGRQTSASGAQSHAEGFGSISLGDNSHAEGYFTVAQGTVSHTEGERTLAGGFGSHAEGYYTTASGDYSHAAGNNTVALGSYQSVIGQYNISSSAQSAFIIGNGTGTGASRSNLLFASGSQVQITGSVIATQGFTGSLFGTASNALSSSNFVITNTLQIDAALVDYVSINPSTAGVNTIYTQATGSYTSAFMKYSVSSGSNTRAGEFMTAWNGTNIVYTDTSTTDIGTTAGISFTSSIVSSQLRVSASCTTAGWNIKTLSTFI